MVVVNGDWGMGCLVVFDRVVERLGGTIFVVCFFLFQRITDLVEVLSWLVEGVGVSVFGESEDFV